MSNLITNSCCFWGFFCGNSGSKFYILQKLKHLAGTGLQKSVTMLLVVLL